MFSKFFPHLLLNNTLNTCNARLFSTSQMLSPKGKIQNSRGVQGWRILQISILRQGWNHTQVIFKIMASETRLDIFRVINLRKIFCTCGKDISYQGLFKIFFITIPLFPPILFRDASLSSDPSSSATGCHTNFTTKIYT